MIFSMHVTIGRSDYYMNLLPEIDNIKWMMEIYMSMNEFAVIYYNTIWRYIHCFFDIMH